MKKSTVIVIVVALVILAGLGVYFFTKSPNDTVIVPGEDNGDPTSVETPASPDTTSDSESSDDSSGQTIVGRSVDGRDITAYHFGSGSKELLFVGGIHGGYSWNTSLVAYELIDYLRASPDKIPAGVRVTVIPVLNPDGLNKVVDINGKFSASEITASQSVQVSGRFNSNLVDLNRNFDCDWQASARWQNTPVSGGTAAFSEPESRAIKSYVESKKPAAVVVWYSSAGGVFSSSCHDGVLSETNTLTNLYSRASGYPGHESFDFYATTGDMTNWLAKIKVPAISVLLSNHTDTEWTKNQAGIEALLEHYGG